MGIQEFADLYGTVEAGGTSNILESIENQKATAFLSVSGPTSSVSVSALVTGEWHCHGPDWWSMTGNCSWTFQPIHTDWLGSKKEAMAVNTALLQMFNTISKEFCLSFVPDHGTEFIQLNQIQERLAIIVYWPDSYSPEQWGTNENTNGLIREYFSHHQNIKTKQQPVKQLWIIVQEGF